MKTVYLESCESTQSYLREKIDREEIAIPSLVWTLNQTAGYGRSQRQWVSPKGNLAFSCAIQDPKITPTWIPILTAISIRRVLIKEGIDEDDMMIKWPNDLLFKGAKFGGILVDRWVRLNNPCIMIGIGLNTAVAPEHVDQPTAMLPLEFSKRFRLSYFLETFEYALSNTFYDFEKFGVAILDLDTVLLPKPGQHVFIDETEGKVLRFGKWGEISLMTHQGEKSFLSGTLRIKSKS